VSIIVAIPSGYALARFKFLLKRPLMILVIYANMFAPIMLLVPIFTIMKTFGITNTYMSVILAGSIFTIPLSTWLTISYMQTIPVEIEEAGFIDGCTQYNVIGKVVLPLMKPALVSIFIYSFITGWSQQFLLALVLINDDKLMPIAQGLYQFFSRSSVRWNELMAAILLSTLVPIALFLLVQNYIVKGLTTGSIK
jgi:multiple sugar transport system permease protein